MPKYSQNQTQETLLKRKQDIKEFQELLFGKLSSKINSIEKIEFDYKYIDFVYKINKKIFVFNATLSSYQVEPNIDLLYWKILSNKTGKTKNPRPKNNPIKYVSDYVKKVGIKDPYFIYPIKNIKKDFVIHDQKSFVGSFYDVIEFIKEEIS